MEFTVSGAAKAPALRASAALDRYRPQGPLSVQSIPPRPPAQPTAGSTPYLVHLASLHAPNPTLLVVSDDSSLNLIDKSNGASLRSFTPFANHRITQAKPFPHASQGSSFLASISNGTVASWDIRSASSLSQPTLTLAGPSRAPYLSIAPSLHGSNPYLVAAGTELHGVDADVDIWDVRSPAAPLFRYTESHSDDVTSLHWHSDPDHADILLTGSTDGLVCAVDTTVSDEDDAVIAVGNTGSSVARAGWGGGGKQLWQPGLGPAQIPAAMLTDEEQQDLQQIEADSRRRALGSVWAVGDMQTLSVWDADKFDPLLEPVDVRSSSCLRPAWTTDYIIDAHCTSHLFSSAASQGSSSVPSPFTHPESGVTLYTGTISGSFAILTASPEIAGGWTLQSLFREGSEDGLIPGHTDIVRCVEYDSETRVLFSGGEDGRLCIWKVAEHEPGSGEMQATQLQQAQMVGAQDPAAMKGATPSFGAALRGGGGGRGDHGFGGGKHSPRSETSHSARQQRWRPYG